MVLVYLDNVTSSCLLHARSTFSSALSSLFHHLPALRRAHSTWPPIGSSPLDTGLTEIGLTYTEKSRLPPFEFGMIYQIEPFAQAGTTLQLYRHAARCLRLLWRGSQKQSRSPFKRCRKIGISEFGSTRTYNVTFHPHLNGNGIAEKISNSYCVARIEILNRSIISRRRFVPFLILITVLNIFLLVWLLVFFLSRLVLP